MVAVELLKGSLGQALLHLINILSYYHLKLGSQDLYPENYAPKLQKHIFVYDIVIIGGGTSGCVLADRLSDVHHWDVLVLEAGGVPSGNTEVPAFYDRLKHSEESWSHEVEPGRICKGMHGKICRISTAKMLGGSSSSSNLHYERASPRDFEEFAFRYEKAASHYENIEKYTGDANYDRLGVSGEILLENFENDHPIIDVIVSGANHLRYAKVTSASSLGYFEVNGYVNFGARYNFAKAFLTDKKQAGNLNVAQGALVTKILVNNPVDRRVYGVEVMLNDTLVTVKARIEVICAAGSVNSAKLLMLSGVGPRRLLQSLMIPVLSDLRVGQNFRDQIALPVFIKVGHPAYQNRTDLAEATYLYLKHNKGAFSKINIHSLVASINTLKVNTNEANIKVYHNFFEVNDEHLEAMLTSRGYCGEVIASILGANEESALLVMTPVLLYPKSSGELLLQSSDPYQPLIINSNFLSDPEDFETLKSGYNYVRALIATLPFQEIDATLLDFKVPYCRNYKPDNARHTNCYIEAMAYPMGRPVGTAQFKGVVDDELLVKGIRHLRVVDASVFPSSLSGSNEATVAMLADKMAADIVKKWNNK